MELRARRHGATRRGHVLFSSGVPAPRASSPRTHWNPAKAPSSLCAQYCFYSTHLPDLHLRLKSQQTNRTVPLSLFISTTGAGDGPVSLGVASASRPFPIAACPLPFSPAVGRERGPLPCTPCVARVGVGCSQLGAQERTGGRPHPLLLASASVSFHSPWEPWASSGIQAGKVTWRLSRGVCLSCTSCCEHGAPAAASRRLPLP